MKKILSILIISLSLYLFYSCGVEDGTNEPTTGSQFGKIEITINWPESSNGMGKVMEKIPGLTNSINITIVHATGTLTDCVDNPGTGTTTLTYFPIPVGPAKVTADAFDPIGCTGVAMATATSTAWTSSAPAVATINAAGLATGLAVGTTNITITSGSISSAPAALTVTSVTLSSISVTPATPTLPTRGSTQQFTATGTFSDSSTKDITASVTWSSSDITKATINAAGLATGLAAGTTTITATSGAISGISTLTVTSGPLTAISLSPVSPSLPKGFTQQFTATGTFSDGLTKDITASVTWSSSDTTKATIRSTGLAAASTTNTGPTTITATSGAISGSTTLTVTSATLTSISVTPAAPSLPNGFKQQFTATGTFSDSSTKDMTTEPISVVANQITSVTLTLDSTIDHVHVTPNPFTVAVNGSVNFTATPHDLNHNVVPVDNVNGWTWSASPGPPSVDPITCTGNGCSIRFRATGSFTITATVTEFPTKSGSATGTVTP